MLITEMSQVKDDNNRKYKYRQIVKFKSLLKNFLVRK